MTILLILISTVILLVVAGAVYQAVGSAADAHRYPPPGPMVDVGGRSLHLIESGSGPAVVFESGISATCINWTRVRTDVAQFARACAYDRAGLGWSDLAKSPRVTSAIITDLHALLEGAQIPRPCILVGHSFGGLVVRAYAAQYPHDVAALVLIDPLSPREWIDVSPAHARRLRLGVRLSRRGALLARVGIVRGALALLMAGGRSIPKAVARASSGRGESVISRLVGEVRKMPPATWPMVRAHWCAPKSFVGMAAYLEALPASAAEAASLHVPESIPVTVLSAANSTPEQLEEREEWARRSVRGKHTVARESGHWIQLDQPELVVEAIREAVRELVTSS